MAGLYPQQRNPHPILDADHYLFASGAGLDDDPCLDILELSLNDPHLVALYQPCRVSGIDRDGIGVGTCDPLQILHCIVGEVGIVIFVLSVFDARQEIVLRQLLLQTVNLALRGMDEDIVI